MNEFTLSPAFILLFVLCAVFLSCLNWLVQTAYKKEKKEMHVQAKASTSALFLIIALVAFFTTGMRQGAVFAMLFVCMVFCLGGDVFLSLANVHSKLFSRFFLLGVGSFMAGHFLFCVLFYAMVPFNLIDVVLPAISLAVVFCCGQSTRFRLKRMHMLVPALVYTVFVALMVTKGMQAGMAYGIATARGALLAAGCVLFFISDALILFVYFYTKNRSWTRAANLILYYIGMLCLALSAAF